MSDPNSIGRWALGVPVIILNAQQAMWETQTVRTMVLQRIVLSFTQCAHDSFLHQLKKKRYNVGELDYSHFCHFKYQPTSCFPPVAKTFFFFKFPRNFTLLLIKFQLSPGESYYPTFRLQVFCGVSSIAN